MALVRRVFPQQFDNRSEGHRAALWVLGALLALKLVVSINSILNTAKVAVGADGFRIESYGAEGGRAVLMLFALSALGQLALALVGVAALVRYRSMVPFMFLLGIGEFAVRRMIIESYSVSRAPELNLPFFLNAIVFALLAVGFALSLWRRSARA